MRSIRRRPVSKHFALAAIACYICGRVAYVVFISESASTRIESFREGECDVVAVLNSDCLIIRQTLDVDANQHERIECRLKLIGVESQPAELNGGQEDRESRATRFATDFLETGPVQLRLDKRRVDEQGRLLGYLYVDGICLNEELARQGLVRVTSRAGDNQSIARRMRNAASLARYEH